VRFFSAQTRSSKDRCSIPLSRKYPQKYNPLDWAYFFITSDNSRMIKSRRIRWVWNMARMGRRGMGKPEGKRPLGRPRRRWVDNNKMYLREIGWDAN
jgi:hypothetical protein